MPSTNHQGVDNKEAFELLLNNNALISVQGTRRQIDRIKCMMQEGVTDEWVNIPLLDEPNKRFTCSPSVITAIIYTK